jgi:hypothetical protein
MDRRLDDRVTVRMFPAEREQLRQILENEKIDGIPRFDSEAHILRVGFMMLKQKLGVKNDACFL